MSDTLVVDSDIWKKHICDQIKEFQNTTPCFPTVIGHDQDVKIIPFEHVQEHAMIPFPLDDMSAFYKDATTFNDWITKKNSADTSRDMFRTIWFMIMSSIYQKDIGTPPIPFDTVKDLKRWADWKDKLMTPDGKKYKEGVLYETAVAHGGSYLFDPRISQLKKHLQKPDRINLPKTNTSVKGNNLDLDEGFVPCEYRSYKTELIHKFCIILQPLRSTKEPTRVAGFIMHILVMDPEWSIDKARHRFINSIAEFNPLTSAMKRHNQSNDGNKVIIDIHIKKNKPKWLHYCVKDLLLENKAFAHFEASNWNAYLHCYDNLCDRGAKILINGGINHSHDNGDNNNNNNNRNRTRNNQHIESQEEIVDKIFSMFADAGKEFFSSSDIITARAFSDFFNKERAIQMCALYDMDINDFDETVIEIDCLDGDRTIIFKSKKHDVICNEDIESLLNGTADLKNRPKIDSEGNRVTTLREALFASKDAFINTKQYDYLYWMRPEEMLWKTPAGMPAGLKHKIFPWENDNSSKVVTIRETQCEFFPNELRSHSNSKKRSASSSIENQHDPESMGHEEHVVKKRRHDKWCNLVYIVNKQSSVTGLHPDEITLGGKSIISKKKGETREKFEDKKSSYLASFRKNEISQEAKMDHITLISEQLADWELSFTRYNDIVTTEVENMFSTTKTLLNRKNRYKHNHGNTHNMSVYSTSEVEICALDGLKYRGLDVELLLPSDFSKHFYKEKTLLRNEGSSRLFRLFKGGSESVMTACSTRISQNFLSQLYHNEKAFTDLFIDHFDYRQSQFACMIERLLLDVQFTMDTFNYRDVILLMFGVFDAYRHVFELHWNYLTNGEAGAGKSHIFAVLKYFFIPGTVIDKARGSDKSNHDEMSHSDSIFCYDELPDFLKSGINSIMTELNKTGKGVNYTSDFLANEFKMQSSIGKAFYDVFQFLGSFRTTTRIVTPNICCILVASNSKVTDAALIQRFHVGSTNANGDESGKNANSSLKTGSYAIETVDRAKTRDMVALRVQGYQSLVFTAEKLCAVYGLPQPTMIMAGIVLSHVVRHINDTYPSLMTLTIRGAKRIVNVARSMTLLDAAMNQYSLLASANVLDRKTMGSIAPYMFCQFHHIVFAITICGDQIINPNINPIFRILLNKSNFNHELYNKCKEHRNKAFDKRMRKEQEQRRLQKQQLNKTNKNNQSNKSANKANNADDEDDEDIDDISKQSPQISPDDFTYNPKDDITTINPLLKYFRSFISANIPSSSGFKTIKVQDEGTDDRVKRMVTYYDLNYIVININSRPDLLDTTHKYHAISCEEICCLLERMKKIKVKADYSLEPVREEDVTLSRDVNEARNFKLDPGLFSYKPRDLPLFDESYTSSMVSTKYGKQMVYQAYICVHALESMEDSSEIITKAIQSIAYKGFRPRKQVMTGFTNKDGSFKKMDIESNPKVPKLKIPSPQYQSVELSKLLRFHEYLNVLSSKEHDKREAEMTSKKKKRSLKKTMDILFDTDDNDPNENEVANTAEEYHEKQKDITLDEYIETLDNLYKKKDITIPCDLDDFAAKHHLLKSGIPICTLKNKNNPDSKKPMWLEEKPNGDIEVRELPTEWNLRTRSLHVLLNKNPGVIPNACIKATRQTLTKTKDSIPNDLKESLKKYDTLIFKKEQLERTVTTHYEHKPKTNISYGCERQQQQQQTQKQKSSSSLLYDK